MAKYRLDRVEAVNDDSGLVRFDVWALDADGVIIPSRHKDVMIPQAELAVAMQAIGAARVTAVKELLLQYAGPGWDSDSLDAEALTNLQAANVSDAVNDWLDMPVEFAL